MQEVLKQINDLHAILQQKINSNEILAQENNKKSAQLVNKENQLNARESELAQREKGLIPTETIAQLRQEAVKKLADLANLDIQLKNDQKSLDKQKQELAKERADLTFNIQANRNEKIALDNNWKELYKKEENYKAEVLKKLQTVV